MYDCYLNFFVMNSFSEGELLCRVCMQAIYIRISYYNNDLASLLSKLYAMLRKKET